MLFSFLLICFITPIYSYCFPDEISNITNTPMCQLIAKESLGCGISRTGAGLIQLTIKCNNIEYDLPSSEDGSTVQDAVDKLTQTLEQYNVSPNCTMSSDPYYGQHCDAPVSYVQQICTFQISELDVYGPACSAMNISYPWLIFSLIILFWIL